MSKNNRVNISDALITTMIIIRLLVNISITKSRTRLTDLKLACHITPTVKENIDTLFNEDLESQMENIYNPLINQRAFHTMSTTTSTYDQKSFRDWLYKSKEQCKLEEDLEISDSVRGCKGIIGFESPCGQGFSNYSSL